MPLELRPNCECCDRDLPPESKESFICSFECTFCMECANSRLGFICPNCGGELVRRPIRPASMLAKHPASQVRVLPKKQRRSLDIPQSEISIARLCPSHALEYRKLMLEAYSAHPAAFTSSVTERTALPQSWWENRLSDQSEPKEVVVGAFDGGKIVGVAGLSFESRQKLVHKAALFGMFVRPEVRGKGIGRKLVLAALECGRSRPVRIVQLTVTEDNTPAKTVYQECGFVPFGVEPYAVAVDGGFVSKLHMWCLLD